MGSARLQSEPCQQPLSSGCARFRAGRAAHSKFAQTHGGNPGGDCTGQGKPATQPAHLHGNSNRAGPGRYFSGSRGSVTVAQSSAAAGKGSGAAPGTNCQSTRRLQKMAANGSASSVRWRFSPRRGQVPQETSFRPRLRSLDGRDHDTGSSRSRPNPKSDL